MRLFLGWLVVLCVETICWKPVGRKKDENVCWRSAWSCLFIHPNMLEADTMRSMSATAAHWVVLTSAVKISGGSVSFTVFSWGEGAKAVPEKGGPLSVSDLLKNFYGFVAARR